MKESFKMCYHAYDQKTNNKTKNQLICNNNLRGLSKETSTSNNKTRPAG